MILSIIVPTYNEEKTIIAILEKIKQNASNSFKYEIILVRLYLKLNNLSAAQNLVKTIDIDNLSYDNKNNLEDIKAKLDYLTN